jgi:hypothetical protein
VRRIAGGQRLHQCTNVFEAEYGGFPAARTGNQRKMIQRFWNESAQNRAMDTGGE